MNEEELELYGRINRVLVWYENPTESPFSHNYVIEEMHDILADVENYFVTKTLH